MAIALDTSVNGGNATGTSLTYSHTCTGNSLILFVAVEDNTGADPTSITYNGVGMTQIAALGNGGGRGSLYYLLNPATGANNVVVNFAVSTTIYAVSASYTGVRQSGVPDASGTAETDSGITTLSKSITTIADNCVTVTSTALRTDQSQAITAGANITLRQANGNLVAIGDSGIITPPASFTANWSYGGSTGANMIVASFAPAIGNNSYRSLLGVGG